MSQREKVEVLYSKILNEMDRFSRMASLNSGDRIVKARLRKSRKISSELTKLLKSWRKETIELEKSI